MPCMSQNQLTLFEVVEIWYSVTPIVLCATLPRIKGLYSSAQGLQTGKRALPVFLFSDDHENVYKVPTLSGNFLPQLSLVRGMQCWMALQKPFLKQQCFCGELTFDKWWFCLQTNTALFVGRIVQSKWKCTHWNPGLTPWYSIHSFQKFASGNHIRIKIVPVIVTPSFMSLHSVWLPSTGTNRKKLEIMCPVSALWLGPPESIEFQYTWP